MEISEQIIRDYCRIQGYDYDKLNLSEDEKIQVYNEAFAHKNGTLHILDGFFSEPRYEWREAIIAKDWRHQPSPTPPPHPFQK